MKKLFVLIITSYVAMYVWIPVIYYLIFGFEYSYYYVPVKYVYMAAIIMTGMYLAIILIIACSRHGREPLELNINISFWAYLAVCIIYAIGTLLGGGYSAAIAGEYIGSAWAYLYLFIDLGSLVVIMLFSKYKRVNALVICGLFILVRMMGGSRAAAFVLIFYFIYGLAFKDKKIRRRTIVYIMILIILSPIVFEASTATRTGSVSNGIDRQARVYINRLSAIELGGIALYGVEIGQYDKMLFQKKYSLSNQAKLAVNSLLPGSIFSDDIQPNQYFRSIFMGYSEQVSMSYYTSLNITLPIYLWIKYSPVLAVIIFLTMIYGLFRFSTRYRNNPLVIILVIICLQDVLYFFDWVMVFSRVLTVLLTVTLLQVVNNFFSYYTYPKDKNKVIKSPLQISEPEKPEVSSLHE